ncbi:hypothetical protein [Luxibacter massiliensis]|nr:hypothetical protein [Luxibacter massiliensis]
MPQKTRAYGPGCGRIDKSRGHEHMKRDFHRKTHVSTDELIPAQTGNSD